VFEKPNCGNGALDAGEDCDIGLDKIPGNADDIDKACEGQCQANCTCLVGNCPPQCPCPDGICPAELKGGLVPCGRRCEDPDTAICECCPCTLCHFFVLAKGVIDFVTLNIVTPLGVLMLVIGGGLFLTAAGDPGRINQGKGIIKAVIIGLIIIFVSWLIVDTIISFLTTGSPFATVFQSWNNINCPVP